MLAVSSTTAIPVRMDSSLMTDAKPSPCIIIFLTRMMNHFAGIMSENHCSTSGMLSQGKMIPENIMVGIVSPIPQISIAVFWLEEMTDTRIPIAREHCRQG